MKYFIDSSSFNFLCTGGFQVSEVLSIWGRGEVDTSNKHFFDLLSYTVSHGIDSEEEKLTFIEYLPYMLGTSHILYTYIYAHVYTYINVCI